MPRINRYREQLRQLFTWFLARWLAKLPAHGWEGTSRELWDAMTAVARRFDRIPAPNVLVNAMDAHVATVTAAGAGYAPAVRLALGWLWSNGSPLAMLWLLNAEHPRRTPAVLRTSKSVAC